MEGGLTVWIRHAVATVHAFQQADPGQVCVLMHRPP